MKIFRKLIRDKIPEIVSVEGKKAVTRVLSDAEFIVALENKLLEEIQELRAGDASKKEEIADIYEVLETLCRANGFSEAEIKKIKEEKRLARGGFDKKLFLENVECELPLLVSEGAKV